MSETNRRILFQDKRKIDNMLNCVARYFANVLEFVDKDVSKKPLVEICRQELHYYLQLTSCGGVQNMSALMNMYDFVHKCHDIASRMWHYATSNPRRNIDIKPFTTEQPYFNADQLISTRTTYTRMDIGGIGQELMQEVEKRASEWLEELDKVLCESAGIARTESASKQQELLAVKRDLAFAIAERIAVMSYESVSDDCLSSRSLEADLNKMYERETPYAHARKSKDERGLQMLHELASNPASDITRRILETGLEELRELVDSPPLEFDLDRDVHNLCNLECLSRAFVDDMDIEVRRALVRFWADNTRVAVDATRRALMKVQQWTPTRLHSILCTGENGKRSNNFRIPTMSFLIHPPCYARKQPVRRTGLSEAGQRSELLIRCVWEMASRGYFIAGVVAADPVCLVTIHSVVVSRMAAQAIATERDMNNVGFRMCAFVANLYNMEGDHVRALDMACCHLSRFSCQELETVFDTTGDSMAKLCECLTHRTRNYMTYKPHSGYKSFVTDSIGMLLPVLYRRRNRLGIPTTMRTNGLRDILWTVPRIREWHPTDGALVLTLDDMRTGHASTRAILEDLHASRVLVTRKGDSHSTKRKVVYCFDTRRLWDTMANDVAVDAT